MNFNYSTKDGFSLVNMSLDEVSSLNAIIEVATSFIKSETLEKEAQAFKNARKEFFNV